MKTNEDLFVEALDLSLAKKYEEAINVFNQLIEQDKNYMDAYHSLAMTHLHAGDVDKGIEVEMKALEINPNELMSRSNLSVFYQKKGMIKEAEEHKAKATILSWKEEERERKKAKENPPSSS